MGVSSGELVREILWGIRENKGGQSLWGGSVQGGCKGVDFLFLYVAVRSCFALILLLTDM